MKRRLSFVAIAALTLVFVQPCPASPFEDGNAAFKAGKFSEAEGFYNRQLAEGGDTAALRFNLGKTREALGDPGGAMLEWERALRLSPTHRPSSLALASARLTSGAWVAPAHWWSFFKPESARGLEGWIASVGAWLLVGAVLGAWAWNWRTGALLLGGSGAFLLWLGFMWSRDVAWEADLALVRERSVTPRMAPADPARSLGDLAAGSRVRILGESAGWNRCALPDGSEGWILSKGIERIAPPQ